MRLTVEGLLFNGICLLCSQGSHSPGNVREFEIFYFQAQKGMGMNKLLKSHENSVVNMSTGLFFFFFSSVLVKAKNHTHSLSK